MARDLRAIATVIESETDIPRVVVSWNGTGAHAVTNAAERPFDTQIGELLDRMSEYASTGAAIAASLNSGQPIAPESTSPESQSPESQSIEVEDPPPQPVLFSLRAILHADSVVLHHGLRVAIVTAAAVLVAGLMHLNHGYWITLTAVVILQPFAAGTRQKAMQRVAGTILGGIVAAALSALFHNAIAVLVLVAVFTMLCVALLLYSTSARMPLFLAHRRFRAAPAAEQPCGGLAFGGRADHQHAHRRRTRPDRRGGALAR